MEEEITLEEIVVLARQLSLDDKVRLIEVLAPAIEREAQAGRYKQYDRLDTPPPDDNSDFHYEPGEIWRTFTYHEEN